MPDADTRTFFSRGSSGWLAPTCYTALGWDEAAARLSWVLRGVADGVAEEARTRGFASLAFASYAFIGIVLSLLL